MQLLQDDTGPLGPAMDAVLGAALQAAPRVLFNALKLEGNELTAAGIASVVPALRRPWGDGGLKQLGLSYNPLGDAGVAALAKALPPSLETLVIDATGCGDDGLVALAAVSPLSAAFLSFCSSGWTYARILTILALCLGVVRLPRVRLHRVLVVIEAVCHRGAPYKEGMPI